MTEILEKLRGGDLRSIGRANEVVLEVEQNPSFFGAVFSGLYDSDPVVRMRSSDVIEKVTKNKNEIIKILKRYLSHKSKIVRVSAMESLAVFAERNSSILSEVIEIIKAQKKTGSPAIQSRGRKLLQRLERKLKNVET